MSTFLFLHEAGLVYLPKFLQSTFSRRIIIFTQLSIIAPTLRLVQSQLFRTPDELLLLLNFFPLDPGIDCRVLVERVVRAEPFVSFIETRLADEPGHIGGKVEIQGTSFTSSLQNRKGPVAYLG